MFTINISPRGWELEEGIPNELCRVLDGICVLVCVCVFSIPSKNTEKSLKNNNKKKKNKKASPCARSTCSICSYLNDKGMG